MREATTFSRILEMKLRFEIERKLLRSSVDSEQSAYRAHHSTETAVNEIAQSLDGGQLCALVLLDFSTAFDTINHQIFLDTMEKRFGVNGIALD